MAAATLPRAHSKDECDTVKVIISNHNNAPFRFNHPVHVSSFFIYTILMRRLPFAVRRANGVFSSTSDVTVSMKRFGVGSVVPGGTMHDGACNFTPMTNL